MDQPITKSDKIWSSLNSSRIIINIFPSIVFHFNATPTDNKEHHKNTQFKSRLIITS